MSDPKSVSLSGDYKFVPTHPTYEELEAEIERLRAQNEECVEVSTQLHAIIERLEAEKARAERAEEALAEWRKNYSAPDCIACMVLYASLERE